VPKVDVSINGRLYAVACDEGQQDRVRELAGMVDDRVHKLSGGNPISGIGETHILVLVGLMLADELSETAAALAAQSQQPVPAESEPAPHVRDAVDEDLLVMTIDHLADRIAVIADRLERA
jgi:cell division protein ZapA